LKILVGTNDLKSGGKQYPVSKLIAHEDYNQPHFANDVGLILIDGEIEYNEKVQPIKYSNKFVKAGTKLRVTGWGRLSVSNFSTLLKILFGIFFPSSLNGTTKNLFINSGWRTNPTTIAST
jgi:Trypsin